MELFGKQWRGEHKQPYPGGIARELIPYSLLSLYKNGYNYKYTGVKKHNGKQGYEVILTPEQEQNVTSITLFDVEKHTNRYISRYCKVTKRSTR